MKRFVLPLNLQLFAEGESGDAATFEINGQNMTAEQVVESYKKLQGEFTKVTQKNSALEKDAEKVKPWLEFDSYLDELSQKKGENIKPQVGKMIDSFISGLTEGKAPTATQMANLGKEIDKAEAKGDDATAKKLEELQSIVMETEFEKVMAGIEKEAKDEGIDFNRKEFNEFADQWLEDLGIGDDDDFDLKLLTKAYQAFEAKKLKEMKKGGIPPLGTSGGASSPDAKKETGKVGGLKGAAQKTFEFLSK